MNSPSIWGWRIQAIYHGSGLWTIALRDAADTLAQHGCYGKTSKHGWAAVITDLAGPIVARHIKWCR